MPALLRNYDEVAMWLGEAGAMEPKLKALLRPNDGSFVIREQNGPKPKKLKSDPQPGLF